MNLRNIIISTLIVGLAVLTYSLTQPYYKNKTAAENLMLNAYNISAKDYHEEESKLRTNKTTLMDLGSGVTIASLTIWLFLYLEDAETLADLKKIKTFNKLTIFISSNIALLLLIPGTYWYYMFRGMREDYPPFADSIAIPIMAQIPVFLYFLIPMNLFIFLTTIKAKLPTELLFKPKRYNWKARFWEMFFGFFFFISLVTTILFIIDGDHISIIVDLFFSFILLTLRAGQLSSNDKDTNYASL